MVTSPYQRTVNLAQKWHSRELSNEKGLRRNDVTPCFYLVPKTGLEPARGYPHYALNVACLPRTLSSRLRLPVVLQ